MLSSERARLQAGAVDEVLRLNVAPTYTRQKTSTDVTSVIAVS